MDIEGRLHSGQRRSHKAMMIPFVCSLRPALRYIFRPLFTTLLAALATLPAASQTATGAQQLAFAGLRSVANQGQFNAIKTDASGNLFLLLDQKDGVRILKTDPTATTLLAQSLLGAAGDIGLSLALDPAGNVYVAGTTTSSTLTGTSGAAFPTRADTSTNSFIAKYDPNLNNLFVTFAGSGRLAATSVAATSDAVFLTGSLFAATLPVTPNAFQQTPRKAARKTASSNAFPRPALPSSMPPTSPAPTVTPPPPPSPPTPPTAPTSPVTPPPPASPP